MPRRLVIREKIRGLRDEVDDVGLVTSARLPPTFRQSRVFHPQIEHLFRLN